MSLNFQQRVLIGMLEGDLQQAWKLLQNENFDMAIHHFQQAVEKTNQMKEMLALLREIEANIKQTVKYYPAYLGKAVQEHFKRWGEKYSAECKTGGDVASQLVQLIRTGERSENANGEDLARIHHALVKNHKAKKAMAAVKPSKQMDLF